MALLAAAVLAAALSAAALWLLRRGSRALPPDIPNARSSHARPVPRAGGYAIWAGFVPVALLFSPAGPLDWKAWLPGWAALVAVSAVDDAGEVGVVPRLAVHAIAAAWAAVALGGGWAGAADGWPAVAATIVAAVALAWSSNLFNFMDGTDGLAASMGAIGFGAYAVASLTPGNASIGPSAMAGAAPALLALVASILPFLAVNRPPASMFMGDVGAVPLGFLAAFVGLAGAAASAWPAWFPLLVFLPFIADATVTLARRALTGERWWEGHRSHYYQRLHQLGAGHAGTLAAYTAAMAGATATALVCRARAPDAGWWLLAAWMVVIGLLFATIDYHWRRKPAVNRPSAR